MFEQFIWIVIPLAITGLGFLSYKQPVIARKLLNRLFIIFTVTWIIGLLYNFGRQNEIANVATMIAGDQNVGDVIFNQLKLANKNVDDLNTLLIICYASAMITSGVFYWLSFLFNNVKNPLEVRSDDTSDKTTL